MKKFILTLITGLALFISAFGQQEQYFKVIEDQSGSRGAGDLTCPVGSLYSQTPQGNSGILPSNGVVFYDNLITSPGGPVGSFTIWAYEEDVPACTPTFDIFIREDDAGAPGALVASYNNLSIPGVNTGETFIGGIIYAYTYNFPAPLNLNTGDWIGFSNYQGTSTCRGFLFSDEGDNKNYAFLPTGELVMYPNDFAFCLGPAPLVPPETPLSDWAIGLGIFLIIGATLLKLKRN